MKNNYFQDFQIRLFKVLKMYLKLYEDYNAINKRKAFDIEQLWNESLNKFRLNFKTFKVQLDVWNCLKFLIWSWKISKRFTPSYSDGAVLLSIVHLSVYLSVNNLPFSSWQARFYGNRVYYYRSKNQNKMNPCKRLSFRFYFLRFP